MGDPKPRCTRGLPCSQPEPQARASAAIPPRPPLGAPLATGLPPSSQAGTRALLAGNSTQRLGVRDDGQTRKTVPLMNTALTYSENPCHPRVPKLPPTSTHQPSPENLLSAPGRCGNHCSTWKDLGLFPDTLPKPGGRVG